MLFFKKKKKVVGVALSGGGLRGIAHLGVLKALEEKDLQPSLISGTSAGAIVGAFYAAGYKPDDLIEIVSHLNFFSPRALRFSTSALFDRQMLLKIFHLYFPENSFSSLKLPLYAAATDIVSGRSVYFNDGLLDEALMASASIPFVFPVTKIAAQYFLDGGIVNNLPVEPIQDQCDILIGVNVNALSYQEGAILSGRRLFDRVVHLALGQPVYQKAKQCDLFISPPDMTRFSMFDKKNARHIFDYGYAYTMQYLDEHMGRIYR
ncbi:patatin-like phospholipase family protein [Niabella aquatica]